MTFLKTTLATLLAAALLAPLTASAKPGDPRKMRMVVHPKKSPYGFLPGYRQPPALTEWRDRSGPYRGLPSRFERRYWSGGVWRYGWGGPGFYRGRYNGGTFGPCWDQTPIGPMWNCGM